MPVVAPDGTTETSRLALAELTVAATPPITTASLTGLGSKFDPVIVITVPTGPPEGEKRAMMGTVLRASVKLQLADVPVGVTSESGPVVAPGGTVTDNCVGLLAVTVPGVPLNSTASLTASALKLAPKTVTTVPTVPLLGEHELTAGGGIVNADELVADPIKKGPVVVNGMATTSCV